MNMILTIMSAVPQRTTSFDWNTIVNNPYISYMTSPAIVFGILLCVIITSFKLGGFKQELSDYEKDIESLKKDVKKLLSHVDIIKTHLSDKSGLDTHLFSAESPLRLLEKGKELLRKSGFENIYKNNKSWFISQIKSHKVKTESDIDEASLKVLEKCRENNKFMDFKEIAFQNGITPDVLLRVLSIYLRDTLSKEILNN